MSFEPALVYGVVGATLFVLGLHGLVVRPHFLRKILGLNISGSGVFLMLVVFGYRPDTSPDPIPHALVLTGIVVAVSASALALALTRRIHESESDHRPEE